MQMYPARVPALLTLLSFIPGICIGADASALWARKIQPLFDLQCVKCHGPIEQKGGLELDTLQAALKGGDSGAVILPGKPAQSILFTQLTAGADNHMPPKKQLSESERETIREWIAALTPAPPSNAPAAQRPATARRPFASVEAAVDALLAESWSRGGVKPAPALADAAWCRRVSLDLIGRIPTADELKSFLSTPPELRRAALVDRLLASPEYPVRMRELWDVFLLGRPKRGSSEDRRRQGGWWSFLEAAFRNNRPWNETVRAVLAARADSPVNKGSTWFLYERKNDHQAIAEAVAPIVYGTRIDCAQCHDHPLAREIKQAHYWGLVTAFNRSKNVEGTSGVAESAVGGFVNFTNLKKESQPALVTLLTGKTLPETWLAGDRTQEDSDDLYVDPKAKVRVPKNSRREAFADLAAHDNPLLGRAFVNRMWAVFFGRGIIHPADQMNERNAPSQPELLDWLAGDFASTHYDVKRLIRGIVLSQAYGLGTSMNAPETFAGALERPLCGEQLARSWRVAAGLPAESDALRKAAVSAIPELLPAEYNASFQQAQFLTSSPALAEILQPGNGNTAERLAAATDIDARISAAYAAVYSREPDAEEKVRLRGFLSTREGDPAGGARDLLWALLTSAEFCTMP
jgi:mono/diheme cytochrome c family protein